MRIFGMHWKRWSLVCLLASCLGVFLGGREAAASIPSFRLIKTNRMLVVRIHTTKHFKWSLRARETCVKRGKSLAWMKDRLKRQYRHKGLMACQRRGYARSRIVPSILSVRQQGRLLRRVCHVRAAVSTICSRYEFLGRSLKVSILSFVHRTDGVGNSKRARYAMALAKRKVRQGYLKRLAKRACHSRLRGSEPAIKVLSFWERRSSQARRSRSRARRCPGGQCKRYIFAKFDLKCIEMVRRGR